LHRREAVAHRDTLAYWENLRERYRLLMVHAIAVETLWAETLHFAIFKTSEHLNF
jgi:hypothetical protein